MEHSASDNAPDFTQPITVLRHCHDKIRTHLATLERLETGLREHGVDHSAQQAATGILRYFNQAAPFHHEDEEHDLFPMLIATAQDQDAEVLRRLGPQIIDEHQKMAQLWNQLAAQLTAIQTAQSSAISQADVGLFTGLYLAHMELEETWIAPMAKRIFSPAQMASLGTAMQRRRGIAV